MLGRTRAVAVGAARRRAAAAVVAGGLALVGCADGNGSAEEPDAVSQSEYLEMAHGFEDERAGYADEVAACAAERGVEAEMTWDHGFVLPPGIDEAEVDEYWEVVNGCAEEIFPPERELSTDEIAEHYSLLLAAKQCLEDEGFEASEPDPFGDFLADYEAGGPEPPWSPFELVAQDGSAFRDAVEVCPQPGRF